MRTRLWIGPLVALAMVITLAVVITAATMAHGACLDGAPDPGFGSSGKQTIAFDLGGLDNDRANAMARVPGTGQLVVVGSVEQPESGNTDIGIAVLTAAGQLDPGFAGDGRLVIPINDLIDGATGLDNALDVVIQPVVVPPYAIIAQRIVVVGSAQQAAGDDSMVAVAVWMNGQLDTSFGVDGIQRIGLTAGPGTPPSERATAVAAQPDGKLVLGGPVVYNDSTSAWLLVRLTVDGQPDPDFGIGGNGLVLQTFSQGTAELADVVLQSDGSIIAVGSSSLAGTMDFFLYRFDPGGSLDTDFGSPTAGVRIAFDRGGSMADRAFAAVVQPDDAIVVVGEVELPNNDLDFGVARLLPGGQLDSSFVPLSSIPGTRTVYFDQVTAGRDSGFAVALGGNGTIVIAGAVEAATRYDFGVVRLLSDGASDLGFGPFGEQVVAWDLGGNLDDRALAVLLTPEGKVSMAGRVDGAAGSLDYGVAALCTATVFQDGFDETGWWTSEWSSQVGR